MKKRYWITGACLLLAGFLLLAGCGKKESSEEISSIYNMNSFTLPKNAIDASNGMSVVEHQETTPQPDTMAEITGMDLSLKSLKVNGKDLAVNIDKQEYTVDYDTTQVTVEAEAKDVLASIVSGPGTYDLEVGTTPITIVIRATEKSQKSYVINVVRKEKETPAPTQPPAQPAVPYYGNNNYNNNYYYVPQEPTVAPNDGVTIIG